MSWKQWLFSCTGVYDCMTVKWVKDLYEVVWVLILCFVVSLGKVEWRFIYTCSYSPILNFMQHLY